MGSYYLCNDFCNNSIDSLCSSPEALAFTQQLPNNEAPQFWQPTVRNFDQMCPNCPLCPGFQNDALINKPKYLPTKIVATPQLNTSFKLLKLTEDNLQDGRKLGFYGSDGCFYPFNYYQQYIPISIVTPFENYRQNVGGQGIITTNQTLQLQTCSKQEMLPRKEIKISKSEKPPKRIQEGVVDFVNEIYQNFHPAPFPSNRPLLLGIKATKYAPGIDTVWRRHFDLLFSSFHPHLWSFAPTDTPLTDWNIFKDMAKVRFSCYTCQHGWTSMHGVVVFYYKFTPSIGRGEVRFALTGQRCIECQNHQFETPMWYPEEAQKVMTNLFYQIASNIYKLKTPPPIKDRRLGRPLKKHVASNCQGCDLGLCKPPATLNSEQSKASPNKGNNNAANISNDRS